MEYEFSSASDDTKYEYAIKPIAIATFDAVAPTAAAAAAECAKLFRV